MSVKEDIDALKGVGLSESAIAKALRLKPEDDPRTAARTVRRWKGGEAASGPAAVALAYMAQGAMGDEMKRVIPEHVVAGDALGEIGHEIVLRLWWPRALAIVSEHKMTPDAIQVDGCEWLNIAMWIDDPVNVDAAALLRRMATAFEIYTADAEGG